MSKFSLRASGLLLLGLIYFFGLAHGASAATYYVSAGGHGDSPSDNNSCSTAQNLSSPKRNIMGSAGGIACLQTPGDKLYVRGGTYGEDITNRNGQNFPSATSWANAFTVASYPNETVTLANAGIGFGDCCQNAPIPQMSYWIFD